MQGHYADPGIFIRSMATRGSLGGLARTTADVTSILDASGRDLVLVETVGVGQDEVDIVKLADVTIVVLVPGMGDDVQSIKAGIMEIADIFVINKADRDGAERVEREIRAMQGLALRHDPGSRRLLRQWPRRRRHPRKWCKDRGVSIFSEQGRGWYTRSESTIGATGWSRCCATRCSNRWNAITLATERHAYAAEIADHKRDPYTIVGMELWTRFRLGSILAKRTLSGVAMFQIDHLGIAVKSLAKAKQFYETLGHAGHARRNCRGREGAPGDGARRR